VTIVVLTETFYLKLPEKNTETPKKLELMDILAKCPSIWIFNNY